MNIIRYVLSISLRGKLPVTECNDASQTSQVPEKVFHKGYLCRTSHNFSQNDLNSVMSAFLIEKMSLEDMINS